MKILIAEELRRTTEEMANFCVVDMDLWNRHSNACLEAAASLESGVTDELVDVALKKWDEWSHHGADINKRIAMKAVIKQVLSS